MLEMNPEPKFLNFLGAQESTKEPIPQGCA